MVDNNTNGAIEIPQELIALVESFAQKRKLPCLFLLSTFISHDTVLNVREQLKNTVVDELDVILATPWWQWNPAYWIAKTLRSCCKKLNIFVPYIAKSAWTFIVLSADSICLWPLWELWPLDVQLKEVGDDWKIIQKSALEEFKALEQIKKQNILTLDDTNTLLSGATKLNLKDIIHLSSEFTWETSGRLYDHVDLKKLWNYSRELEVGRWYAIKILSEFGGMDVQMANEIVYKLVYWYPSHSFIIDDVEAKTLRLPIVDNENVKDDLLKLNQFLYGFMSRLFNEYSNKNIFVNICVYRPLKWNVEVEAEKSQLQ